MIRQIQNQFEENPIIQHTIHQSTAFTIRQLLWGIVPVSWSLAALGTVAIFEEYYALVSFLWFVLWGVMIFSPVIIAGITAQWIVTEIQTGQFELLYLTTMTDEKLVWGYIISMLYRMRLLVALTVAIMPLLVICTFYMLIWLNAVVTNISPFVQPVPPSRLEILVPTLIFTLLIIGMWEANGLGAATGVSFALRYRQRGMAIIASIAASTFAMFLLTSAVWFALLIPQAAQVSITICAPVVFVVFFLLIWDYILRGAHVSVRMPSEE